MTEPAFDVSDFRTRAVSPFLEMGAYEAPWTEPKTTFKSLSARFARRPGGLPSDFVSRREALECAAFVERRFEAAGIERFGVRIHGAGEYPDKLRDAVHPVECLYYRGWWDLAASRSVAVVGSRKPSRAGLARARRLARDLVNDDVTVVSGLAAGIDRAAHETAIAEGGRTIAVVGAPPSHVHPTEATVIVEAGDTSGTPVQARAALARGREPFILDNRFRDSRLVRPGGLVEKGAIRVEDYDDIGRRLSPTLH